MASAGTMISFKGQQLHHCRCNSLRMPAPSSSQVSIQPSTLGFASSSIVGRQQQLLANSLPNRVNQTSCNGRLLIEAKGRKNPIPRTGQSGGTAVRMAPRIPDFDPADQTPYFSIFIRGRAKRGRPWLPLTIVAGGSTATPLLQLMSSPFGKKLYLSTLTRNMAMSVTKDGATMVSRAKEVYPELQDDAAYDFGYKIVDKKNPKAGFSTADVILIPPESEMKSALDKVREFVGGILPPSSDNTP